MRTWSLKEWLIIGVIMMFILQLISFTTFTISWNIKSRAFNKEWREREEKFQTNLKRFEDEFDSKKQNLQHEQDEIQKRMEKKMKEHREYFYNGINKLHQKHVQH